MQTWIALLRGINVGGNNILPMKALREYLEARGFQKVRTYIQSGNCVFEHGEKDPLKLAKLMAGHIDDHFGFRPQVMMLTLDELKAAMAQNPYAEEGAKDPKCVHFFFLSEAANDAGFEALEEIRTASEHFELAGAVFYLHAPEGIGRSKLAARAEKHLGVPTTARNLRSVTAIAELAG